MDPARVSDMHTRALANLVENALAGSVLRGFGRCRIALQAAGQQGASGSVAYKTDASLSFFVKYDVDPRVREKEIAGHRLLAKAGAPRLQEHLLPPLIEGGDLPLLLFPLLDDYETLHDWIRQNESTPTGQERSRVLYRSILTTFYRYLWKPTRSDTQKPQVRKIYELRARERLSMIVQHFNGRNYQRTRLRINGEDLGELGGLVAAVTQAVRAMNVPFSCTVHGDEHPKNVMVGPDEQWFLIDFASASDRVDWVYSLAKILHWWRGPYALHSLRSPRPIRASQGQLRSGRQGPVLEFSYDEKCLAQMLGTTSEIMHQAVLEFARSVARSFGDPHWIDRLPIAYFSVVVGNVPGFLKSPQYQFFAGPMLHDAVRALRSPASLFQSPGA